MTYKTIISGRLEFGSSRSYDKVLKMYQHRVESFYKSDVLLIEEEIFDQDTISLNVPRFITQSTTKSWKNTLNLLDYVAQFAVAGSLNAWMTENGKVLNYHHVEPQSEKVAVQQFLKGRSLSNEQGKENEAIQALNRAIEKYERHALAYERRGYVNFLLRNYNDAIYDYSKSISINPTSPDPFMGRAHVKITQGDLKSAVPDLEKAIKNSIPLQPIYWKARRIKADCLIKLKDFEAAELDLKLFANRRFTTDNPNYKWRKRTIHKYGEVLIKLEKYMDAITQLDICLEIEKGKNAPSKAQHLLLKGIALQKAGKPGYAKTLKEAAKLGSKKAAQLLTNIK